MAIAAALPPDVAPVGVFVDPARTWVCEVAERVGLAAVQLHGRESADFCQRLPYRVMKAVPLRGPADVDVALQLPADITVLLDVHDPVRRGGTGHTVDWVTASAVATQRRTFLAGGIGPDNVAEAIQTVRPYGLDVSSRLEVAPGVKDAGRLRAFFDAVQSAPSGVAKRSV